MDHFAQKRKVKHRSTVTEPFIPFLILYSRSKSPAESFNHYFRAYQNQIHPNQQLSSYRVKDYSRKSYNSQNQSNRRNR